MEQEPDDLDILQVLCLSNESIDIDKTSSLTKPQNNPNSIATEGKYFKSFFYSI